MLDSRAMRDNESNDSTGGQIQLALARDLDFETHLGLCLNGDRDLLSCLVPCLRPVWDSVRVGQLHVRGTHPHSDSRR